MQDLQLDTTRQHGHSRSRRIKLKSTRLLRRMLEIQLLRLQLLQEYKGSMLNFQFSCCCKRRGSSSTHSSYLLFPLSPKIPRYRLSQPMGYIFWDREQRQPQLQQLLPYYLLVHPYLSFFCPSFFSFYHQLQPLRVYLPLVLQLLQVIVQHRALVLLRFLP